MLRTLVPLSFGILGIAILVSLGVWQMQRLSEKQNILSEIDTRITAAPVAVPANAVFSRDQYRPVTATGIIETGELHVLVSRKRVGAGYRIIAPMILDDGRRILLDRGFTKTNNKQAQRPVGEVTLLGNLHWPDETGPSIPEADIAANIWFARDIPSMAEALGTEPILLVARDATPSVPNVTPLPVDTAGIPNNHLQYAVTWFSLAAIWAAMTLSYLWRARNRQGHRS